MKFISFRRILEFYGKRYCPEFSDAISHVTDDAISEALLLNLIIIEIIEIIDSALLSYYCLIKRL